MIREVDGVSLSMDIGEMMIQAPTSAHHGTKQSARTGMARIRFHGSDIMEDGTFSCRNWGAGEPQTARRDVADTLALSYGFNR